VVPIVLAYALGIALPSPGATLSPALLPPVLLLSLFLLWHRPWPTGAIVALLLAGLISGESYHLSLARDCRFDIPSSWEGEVEGRFLTRPTVGRSFPFRIESGAPGGCDEVIRASLPAGADLPLAGERIAITGRWVGRAFPLEHLPEWAGTLRFGKEWRSAEVGGLSGGVLSFRGKVQERIVLLWGEDTAPMVEALVLGRREHVDAGLRESFSLSGTVHLIAISGFHVGVIAALLVGLLRVAGLRPRSASGWAVVVCWIYVLGIGAPHAAVRASLLFTLLVTARLRGRPVVSSGTLATCALILLALNPGWLFSVGFQLSFAGTAGLIFLRTRVSEWIGVAYLRVRGRRLPSGRQRNAGEALLKEGAGGLAAGIAATLPTLPLLVWHFDRISLLGIPLTLILAPIVAMVIPGIGLALFLSLLHPTIGAFVAGGTGLLLEVGNRIVLLGATLPGASFWVSREALLWVSAASFGATLLLRLGAPRRVRREVRIAVAAGWGVVALLLLPLLPKERVLELHMIDVGQGDAIALRTPSGRWVLIDAGPRSATFDAGERRVVPYLKREGVRRIEALFLTHPHLDHIGGAPAVLRAFPVRGIIDPSRPHGSRPYLQLLEEAEREGGSWWRAREGMTLQVDGVSVHVLHPSENIVEAPRLEDPNDLSIVLLIRWGRGTILLTGDAPASVEHEVLEQLSSLTLLKVGHHGSRTSTSSDFLAVTRPQYAVIGVGDGNNFGHPHPEVMERIARIGTEVLRTDRDGDIRVRIRFNGEVEAHATR